MQNPYIRQFGKRNFNVQSYLDEVLSKNDATMIKHEYRRLKKSHQSLQREIGNFLFNQYQSFLTTSEKLETVKYQIDDAKALLGQYQLIINSFKGQIERLEMCDREWSLTVNKENLEANTKINSKEQNQQLFESANKFDDEIEYINEQLEMIE